MFMKHKFLVVKITVIKILKLVDRFRRKVNVAEQRLN